MFALVDLENAPFAVVPHVRGSADHVRARIASDQAFIRRNVAHLIADGGAPAPLSRVQAAVDAAKPEIEQILDAGASPKGYTGPDGGPVSRDNVTLQASMGATLGLLTRVGRIYSQRATAAKNRAVIGSLLTIVLLLAAFAVFYRRARRAQTAASVMETAFSDAPGGVALMSMDGRFLRVNESLRQMFGRPEQEIIGCTSAGFSHPDDRGTTAEAYDALRNAGARVCGEKRYLRPDGQVVWASTNATAITGPDGELTHIVAHFWDITEQRSAEEQLRASEENLRTVAAVARRLPTNENPRQAICAAAAGIAGADIVQLWEPDGADQLRVTAAVGIELPADVRLPLTGEITATAIAYHRREPVVYADLYAPDAPMSTELRDRVGMASALYEPVLGRDGALGVLVVMWRTGITHASAQVIDAVRLLAIEAAAAIERADLTARLNEQERAERVRLRQLLEGTPDAMIISGSDGVIHTVNDQTLRLLGYAREELIGGSVDQLVPTSLRAEHPLRRASFAAQPSGRQITVERELTALHKDGGDHAEPGADRRGSSGDGSGARHHGSPRRGGSAQSCRGAVPALV
jgi:PAS domain S-box-containing protein